jgi:hypothetical protein
MSSPPLPLPPAPWNADALSLYQRLLPASFWEPFEKQSGHRHNNRIYTFLVVMWLFIAQRLHGLASLETAVLELLRGLPPSFWPRPCQRLRDWREGRKLPSANTGAYNQARQALPLCVVEQSCDRIFEQLTARLHGSLPAVGRRAFFVDGTSVRAAHSPALCQAYPPSEQGHWPVLRMVVAHDLQTSLAMRPQWGPMYGAQAVSEQKLLEEAMDRLPEGAVLVGDANFGVFSVAYAAARRDRPVVFRLTPARALHLSGGALQDGLDRAILWKPSRDDRRKHPDLPADACVRGRLIARRVHPYNGAPLLLYLFTSLSAKAEAAVELYGQRWNIETDLRSLKSTLDLEQLTCTTPEMVAKELNLAMAAYNLVRAITCLAAERSGIPPRGYSFTRIRRIIETFTPLVANAKTPEDGQRYFDQMMHYVGQAKLPRRKRRRPSYPRAVWGRGDGFPRRKSEGRE